LGVANLLDCSKTLFFSLVWKKSAKNLKLVW